MIFGQLKEICNNWQLGKNPAFFMTQKYTLLVNIANTSKKKTQ